MTEEKTDRRFNKTENAINSAFIELIRTKRYDKITVQNILDKADIGRTTFYSHYQTKDELLSAVISNIMESLTAVSIDEEPIIPVAQVLEHIKENQSAIKSLLTSDNADLISNHIKGYWSEKLAGKFYSEAEKRKIPINLYVNHIITSFIGLTRWWLNNDMPETPRQMEEYWIRLVTPCF